ncbi:MAG: GNAT family N-acetyltransferase [Candidatus Thorarchaeota archaeon]|jgi:ribosomal protein S18 acetylase RimI-like enzyme
MSGLEFVVGYDVERFKEYYIGLNDLHAFYRTRGLRESNINELRDAERGHIESNPDHLIVWMDQDQIVGHTIWHETSTDEMTPGNPRDENDRETLRKLFGGKRENLVELHEVWLKTEHRGRRLGHHFLSFFEEFIRERGFDGIVYYTDSTAAIALCRRRGYGEEYLESEGWYVFSLYSRPS